MDRMDARTKERLALHRAFWKRQGQARPIADFRVVPDFFFSRHYGAARELLVPGKRITADMLHVDNFLPDYESMYYTSVELDQDAFWVAEPFTGIPWMEAILGCEVYAGEESFVSKPWMTSLGQLDRVRLDPDNTWFQKYLEFTRSLVRLSDGRFTVGMPIMRGPADMAGALMGQTEMVLALMDERDRMKEFFLRTAEAFRAVIDAQNALIPPFLGGTALGFYHVYCPGPSIWYQEDLTSIMSPALYRDFLSESERRICAGKEYTAIHLHPSSFFILDELLKKDDLGAIEVNKDVGGPSVEALMPELKKIQAKKSLILWGDLDGADLECIKKNLSPDGLFLQIIAPTMEQAERLRDTIRGWTR
jgi:hypothetical protein